MWGVFFPNFLQQNNVCWQFSQEVALVMQGKAGVKMRNTFMDIKSCDTQSVVQVKIA